MWLRPLKPLRGHTTNPKGSSVNPKKRSMIFKFSNTPEFRNEFDRKIVDNLGLRQSHWNSILFCSGLVQLVERLTHWYSYSMSSNPGNLTSVTVCGDRTGSKPATKRSAHVAPEVHLRECTLYSAKKRIRQNPLWLWNPEETSPEIQNRGTSGPQKGHVSTKNLLSFHVWNALWIFGVPYICLRNANNTEPL